MKRLKIRLRAHYEGIWDSGSIAPLIHISRRGREEYSVLCLAVLPRVKHLLCPLNCRLGETHQQLQNILNSVNAPHKQLVIFYLSSLIENLNIKIRRAVILPISLYSGKGTD